MKAVFMGTPDFAVPTLQKMIDMGIEITAVVTQPDKAKGRGKKVIYSPVKECALAHDLPVYQPVRIRKEPECACLPSSENSVRQHRSSGLLMVKR